MVMGDLQTLYEKKKRESIISVARRLEVDARG